MHNHKRTIKQSIFYSHILIIFISVILTSVIFNICLKVYVRRETRNQLITAAELVQKSMVRELFNTDLNEEEKNQDREVIKSYLKINKTLKQTQSFLDINYMIIGQKGNIIAPIKEKSEKEVLSQSSILYAINKNSLRLNKANKDFILLFKEGEKQYSAVIQPVKLENGKKIGYLFLYSNLDKSKRLTLVVNIILLCILLITAVVGLFISRSVSSKISKPITSLSKFAKRIGEREYDIEYVEYEDDEIGQLAETMHNMATKLSSYDKAMKTFLQNSSHELRTPLMSIQGYAEGIKYGVVEDKEKAVEIIIEESKRLSSLVEELLYLSKIDSMEESLKEEVLNVEYLLKSCMERVEGIGVNKDKKLSFSCKYKDIMIKGDEEKLSRAIINILGNCLRYARKNIEVILEKNDLGITIIIKDDGPGFLEEDLEKVFHRFYKGEGGNYGLGLAITKSIIEKHNGNITAENNQDGGACFRITL